MALNEWTVAEVRKNIAMWCQCPYCGVDGGTYCVTEWGETAYRPHKARMDLVTMEEAQRETDIRNDRRRKLGQ